MSGKDFHPRGWIYEHRWVVEQHLGRRLEPTEHVHHRNGDKLDNRIENLEVAAASDHTAHHNLERPRALRGRWSGNHDTCVECGKTESPHTSGGRCCRCYMRARMQAKRDAQGVVTLARRRAVWSIDRNGREWHACRDCGRSDRRVGGYGVCDTCCAWRKAHNGEPRPQPKTA